MTQQCISHSAPTFKVTVLLKKIHTSPRCGLVKIQFARHIYVLLGFGVVLIGKVYFFLPVQFFKAVDFTLALLYPNFKLQYLMNYSSDFNNYIIFADSNC